MIIFVRDSVGSKYPVNSHITPFCGEPHPWHLFSALFMTILCTQMTCFVSVGRQHYSFVSFSAIQYIYFYLFIYLESL